MVCVPHAVGATDIARLRSVATQIAANTRYQDRVRLQVHFDLPDASDVATCDAILFRILALIDADFPSAAASLCEAARPCTSLCEMHLAGDLGFAPREPALNVYTQSGKFAPHKDHEALTVLIPLTSADSFTGGGTGFWRPGEPHSNGEPPAIVLTPPAGTAMLFSGDVTHAGLQVEGGTRVVFVASFSARRSASQRARIELENGR